MAMVSFYATISPIATKDFFVFSKAPFHVHLRKNRMRPIPLLPWSYLPWPSLFPHLMAICSRFKALVSGKRLMMDGNKG
jgi:hypothetical protein